MKYKKTLERAIKKTEKEYEEFAKVRECNDYLLGYTDGLAFALGKYKERATIKVIHNIIQSFVRNNYGRSEASNPAWSIDCLAEEIEKEL